MPPGQKRGQSKAQTAVETPPTDYEKDKAKNLMRNNQILHSLGVSTLASILNNSRAKGKQAALVEDSDSLYEPEDSEDGVVDKTILVQENSPCSRLTRNTTVSSGGPRGSKRVYMPSAGQEQTPRLTRQRTRELSSAEEGLQGTASNTQEDAIAAEATDQTEICNEGEQAERVEKFKRGRSKGLHLDKMSRGLNAKIPVIVSDGKRRPDAPVQAAKLASESGIIIKQKIPVYTHWKEYKKDQATQSDYMARLAVKFSIDTDNKAVTDACTDLLKGGTRQYRHKLKKKYFDDVPANQVQTTAPLENMTQQQWQALVHMWSDPKHKEKCEKAKVSRGLVKYPHTTGSRCYIAQTHVVKQDKYKDEPPNAIDLFKELHCSSRTGFTEPVKEAIARMEAIMTEPAQEGQAPKTPAEVVAQVLPSSKFLQNIGLQPAATKKCAKAAVAARVQELEAEVEMEKQDAAALRDKIESQRDELELLKQKMSESEEASQNQLGEIAKLKQQGEETNSLLRRLLCLNKE